MLRDYQVVVYVVDLTGDYVESLSHLCSSINRLMKAGVNVDYEVFLHKADGLEKAQRNGISPYFNGTYRLERHIEGLDNQGHGRIV